MEENSSQQKNDNRLPIKLAPLSPLDKKNDERVKIYIRHINDAVEDKNVKNLALTGVYGSGKSTILKSYQSKYNKESLNISLSSFKETDNYEKFKNQIQLTILQQIIYSQNGNKFKESRINRIIEIDIWKKELLLKVVVLIVFIISFYSVVNYFSSQLNPNNWNLNKDLNWGSSLSLFIFIFSSFLIGQQLLKTIANYKINSINIKGVELGKSFENKDLLSKYLDEILYFFKKTPIEVVIIEDLDRFNSTEIFRTLRELNFILNKYLKNTKGNEYKKVTFVYAVKDNLFVNELDRTKFFDLIIPTIPFIDYSNSKNVLIQELKKVYGKDNNLFKRPDGNRDFINTVSSFITDGRILINIVNEFIVYKEQQKLQGIEQNIESNEGLNEEKLFALIIYKNLRPKDFAKLHNSKSNIDIVFKNKRFFFNSSIKYLEKEINALKTELKEIKQENVKSIKNLNTIFLYHIRSMISNTSSLGLIIDSKKISFEDIINKESDLNFYYNNYIYWYNTTNNILRERLNSIDKIVGYKYSEKYKIITNAENDIISKEKKIIELREKQNDIRNQTLGQIFKRINVYNEKLEEAYKKYYTDEEIESDSYKIYNDPLLIFLLENGYIDEQYKVYISIFQKGGLSVNDNQFKINVISRVNNPKDFNYDLDNIGELINDIPLRFFKDSRILNTSLIDFFIEHKSTYKEKFNEILKTISNWDYRSRKFFIEYLYHGSRNGNFIELLSKTWSDLWKTVESDDEIFYEKKNELLYIILYYLDNDTIISLNIEGLLTAYISNNAQIVNRFFPNGKLERIEEIFQKKVLNIKFKDLRKLMKHNLSIYSGIYLDIIYKNNYYRLNDNNIRIILEYYLEDNLEIEKFKKANLDYIYKSNLVNMIKYIENDSYNLYISDFYSNFNLLQEESEDTILRVLNKEGLLKDNATTFLERQKTKINDIEDVSNLDFYDLLFGSNIIKASWFNVIYYYELKEYTFDNYLNIFLNEEENYSKLSDSSIRIEENEGFVKALISNNDLQLEPYKKLINSISNDYELPDNYDFKKISKEKVNVLISSNVVKLNIENYYSLEEIYPNLHIILLVKNEKEFLDFIDMNRLEDIEILLVLKSNASATIKQSLIDEISVTEMKENNELINIINSIILETSYSKLSIEKLEVLLDRDLSVEQKIQLILLYESELEKDDIIRIFNNYLPKKYTLLSRNQVTLIDDENNLKLIFLLQKKNIAGKYKQKKGRLIVYLRKFRKPPTSKNLF